MKRILNIALVTGFAVSLAPRPVAAQLQGLPVYFNPKGGTGLTISGDFGRAVSTKVNGVAVTQKPVALGGSVRLGLPIVTVGLAAGIFDPMVTTQLNETQYAGTAAVKVFGGGLLPVAVSLQGGAGYLKQGSGTFATKTVNIPVGVGVALSVPTPGASIEPWVAGRVQLNSVTVGQNSGTQLGYGVSGGLSLGLPIGLGLHAAVDWVSLGAKPSSPITQLRDKVQRVTAGAGIHFSIKIPGLPGIPII